MVLNLLNPVRSSWGEKPGKSDEQSLLCILFLRGLDAFPTGNLHCVKPGIN